MGAPSRAGDRSAIAGDRVDSDNVSEAIGVEPQATAPGQFSVKKRLITQDSVTEFVRTLEVEEIIEASGRFPEKTQSTITNFLDGIFISISFELPLKIHEVTVIPTVSAYNAPDRTVFMQRLHVFTI
jgi:hypothetical protein